MEGRTDEEKESGVVAEIKYLLNNQSLACRHLFERLKAPNLAKCSLESGAQIKKNN